MKIPNEAAKAAMAAAEPYRRHEGEWRLGVLSGVEAAMPFIIDVALKEAGTWCCDEDQDFLRNLADETVQDAEQ